MSSGSQNKLRDRIPELTELCLRGVATAEQVVELEKLIQADSAARQYYLKYVYDAQSLRDWAPAQSEPAAPEPTENLPQPVRTGVSTEAGQSQQTRAKDRVSEASRSKGNRRRAAAGRRNGIFAAVATAIGVFALLFSLRSGNPRPVIDSTPPNTGVTTVPVEPAPAAIVTKIADCRWQGTAALQVGSVLQELQQFRLLQGIAEIRFLGGATVTLQGPSTFAVISPQSTRLQSGILTAYVPPKAVGFQVQTDALQIVDLGTSFGVSVQDNSDTNVSVFSGSVEVSLPGQTRQAAQTVGQGESVHARLEQPSIESVAIVDDRFHEPLKVSTGIESIEGDCRFVAGRVTEGMLPRDNSQVLIGLERRDFTLPEDLRVNLRPDIENGAKSNSRPIPAGTRVGCFLGQFDPPDDKVAGRNGHTASFRITFEQPIIGIIAGGFVLQKSDQFFADRAPELSARQRGSESPAPRQPREQDELVVSEDRRTIDVTTRVLKNMDQVRIIVDATGPDTQSTVLPEPENE